MPLITWSDQYSVGIQRIDEQHKKLVDLINELFDAMKLGKGNEVITKTLGGLLAYTKTHFSAEEMMLKQNGYPDFDAHKKIHDAFTAKVQAMNDEARSGAKTLTLQVNNFLKDWLINHIQGTDKKYTPFMKSKGVS